MWILTSSSCQSTQHAALLSAEGSPFTLWFGVCLEFGLYECWCSVMNEDIIQPLARAYVSASYTKLFWHSTCFCFWSQHHFMTAYLNDLSIRFGVCARMRAYVCELFFCSDASMCKFMWKCEITHDLTDEGTPGNFEQLDMNWKTAQFVSAVWRAKCHRKSSGEIFLRHQLQTCSLNMRLLWSCCKYCITL